MTPGHSEARLMRQPIVDRNRNLVGFELLYAGAHEGSTSRRTAEIVSDLFHGVGVEHVLGTLVGHVDVDSEFLGSRLVEVLPPERVRLELGDTVGSTAETVARCQALRGLGYRLVADNYWGDRDRIGAILQHIDSIKVDLDWVTPDQLSAVARPFAGRKKLIAEKVESSEQFQLAMAQGFDYFQGFHFARPEMLTGKRPAVDPAALMRLINFVVKDADSIEIENEFKRQPLLTVQLLKLANSAAVGMRTPASTLREAIMRLGRRALQTWLQLLVYTANSTGASPLLHTAAMRGKLMELVAAETRPEVSEFSDRALLVGLLSLMHVVFGRTQAQFVAELELDADLKEALESRTGPLGELQVVEAREAAAGACQLPEKCDAAAMNRLEMEAFRWATEVALPQ